MDARTVCGKQVRTCSPECSAALVKLRRKENYARNREKVIADARAWAVANREYVQERERRRREANKDAIRAQKEEYRLANLDRIRERQAAWHQANRERIRAEWAASRTEEKRAIAVERARQWAQANPERRAELRRQYARANPDKVAARTQRRRARQRGVPSDLVTVTELMRDQDFLCYLCNTPIDPACKYPHPMCPSIDHVIPLAKGGTGLRENLRAAHMGCNSAKRDRLLPPEEADPTERLAG